MLYVQNEHTVDDPSTSFVPVLMKNTGLKNCFLLCVNEWHPSWPYDVASHYQIAYNQTAYYPMV